MIITVPLSDVHVTYGWEYVELSRIFSHDVVLNDAVWRWRENSLARYLVNNVVDMNQLRLRLVQGAFSIEAYVKFHMQISYSLSGFNEVFGQDEASEGWGIDDALPRKKDDGDAVTETVIQYLCRKHKGQVLKL